MSKSGCFWFWVGLVLCWVLGFQVVGQGVPDQLKKIRSSVVETIDGRDFYIHTIKRGQTLYMISKAYSVDINDIIRENPGVKEGIRADETLRIPVRGQSDKPKKAIVPEQKVVVIDSQPVPVKSVDSLKIESRPVLLPCALDQSSKKPVYHVALMLPLYLGDVTGLNAEKPDRKAVSASRSLQFLPFYEGFLMAIDSLKKTGLAIRLYVYDVDKDTSRTKQLLKKPELKSMDLIIGVLYHRNFQIVADFARKNKISIVNPISERTDILTDNPFVFKIQPAKSAQPQILAKYLKSYTANGKILIVRNGQYPDKRFPDQLYEACRELNIDATVVEGQQSMISQLSQNVENFVIAYSTKTEYVADFTRRLFELRNSYRINLIGLPDWQTLNGIELEYLSVLKTHAILPGFVDYYNPWVSRFVADYQSRYLMDPPVLAFQGYDAAWYFLNALNRYGTGFARCLEEMDEKCLLTRYKFQSSEGNGYENQQWMINRFESYRLVPEFVY